MPPRIQTIPTDVAHWLASATRGRRLPPSVAASLPSATPYQWEWLRARMKRTRPDRVAHGVAHRAVAGRARHRFRRGSGRLVSPCCVRLLTLLSDDSDEARCEPEPLEHRDA